MPKKSESIYDGYGNLILAIFGKNQKDLLPLGDEEIGKINQALDKISSREAEVIRLRFGLNLTDERPTLRAIGEMINKTGERVRQIEAKGIKKLRRRHIIGDAPKWFKSSDQDKIEILTKENEQLKTELEKYKSYFRDVEPVTEHLFKSVEELELSVRVANILRRLGIHLVGDLVSCGELDLLRSKNFGLKSLYEVKEALAKMGLALNTKIPGM